MKLICGLDQSDCDPVATLLSSSLGFQLELTAPAVKLCQWFGRPELPRKAAFHFLDMHKWGLESSNVALSRGEELDG
jgi:hypothetical protein